MDGCLKTSTLDVTKEGRPFVSSRLKMEIALVDLPRLNGHQSVFSILVGKIQYYLTSHSLLFTLHCKLERRLSAIVSWDLALLEVTSISYALGTNHLMEKEIADHLEIRKASIS